MSAPLSRALTVTSNVGLLPEIKNKVGICPGFNPKTLAPGTPHPPFHEFIGLWDTGATNSAITDKVIAKCGLKPTGMVKVGTAAGEVDTETYLVNVALPNRVAFSNMTVTRGDLRGTDLLIGMDIINKGDLALTNFNGKTVFSFRVPSQITVDFVKESESAGKQGGFARPTGNPPADWWKGKKKRK